MDLRQGSRRWFPSKPLVLAGAMLAVSCLSISAYAALSASPATHSRQVAQQPKYDPAKYTTRIDNPWFPLRPGTVYVYRGKEGTDRTADRVRVTHRTIVIAGVTCRVVKDRVFTNGRLSERTKDYYAQDEDGNVWYFGEDTAELDRNGNVTNRDGTWRTGRHNARAGVFMQQFPQPRATYFQELDRGNAEDFYRVVNLTSEVKTPYGTFGRNKLRHSVEKTLEWTPLEPNIRENKYYAFGVGQVKEKVIRGPQEVSRLVRIKRS